MKLASKYDLSWTAGANCVKPTMHHAHGILPFQRNTTTEPKKTKVYKKSISQYCHHCNLRDTNDVPLSKYTEQRAHESKKTCTQSLTLPEIKPEDKRNVERDSDQVKQHHENDFDLEKILRSLKSSKPKQTFKYHVTSYSYSYFK